MKAWPDPRSVAIRDGPRAAESYDRAIVELGWNCSLEQIEHAILVVTEVIHLHGPAYRPILDRLRRQQDQIVIAEVLRRRNSPRSFDTPSPLTALGVGAFIAKVGEILAAHRRGRASVRQRLALARLLQPLAPDRLGDPRLSGARVARPAKVLERYIARDRNVRTAEVIILLRRREPIGPLLQAYAAYLLDGRERPSRQARRPKGEAEVREIDILRDKLGSLAAALSAYAEENEIDLDQVDTIARRYHRGRKKLASYYSQTTQ